MFGDVNNTQCTRVWRQGCERIRCRVSSWRHRSTPSKPECLHEQRSAVIAAKYITCRSVTTGQVRMWQNRSAIALGVAVNRWADDPRSVKISCGAHRRPLVVKLSERRTVADFAECPFKRFSTKNQRSPSKLSAEKCSAKNEGVSGYVPRTRIGLI